MSAPNAGQTVASCLKSTIARLQDALAIVEAAELEAIIEDDRFVDFDELMEMAESSMTNAVRVVDAVCKRELGKDEGYTIGCVSQL